MTGEDDNLDLDFSYEELEFITGDDEQQEGDITQEVEGVNPNEVVQSTATDDAGEGKEKDITAEDEAIAEEKAKEGTENEGSESVGTGSADEGKDDGKETSPQLYQTLTDVLKEQGVFSSVDDSSLKDIKDVDGLIEIIKSQIEAEELKDLSDVQKTVLKDMREGVSVENADTYKKSMDQLNAIDDELIAEDKQVRFDLIYQDFLSKGFDKAKASKYANRSFELKEDELDAKEAKNNLITAVQDRYNTSKEKDLNIAKEEAARIVKNKDDLKKKILESKEVIKGVEIPEEIRNSVYEEMSKTVSTNPITGVPENSLMQYQREKPVEFSHRLYYLFKVTNGFEDIDYFTGKKATSSVNKLERALKQSTHVSGGGNPSFADDGQSHSLDIGELILPD